jgi:ABC-2 type transport system permease protein
MKAVFNKEFKSYFNSALGYIFMAVFLLISGIFFSLSNIITQQPNTYFNPVLSNITFVFLLLVPVITMRTIAEETHQKTDQLLYTTPISLTEIILGKYFAAVALFLITLLITCIYPLILSIYGTVDVWSIVGSYIGFALLGSSFIAIGIFISSLTDNQVVSAVGTFGALLLIWILGWIQQSLPTSQKSGIIFAAILVFIICLIVYASTHNIYVSGIVGIAGAAVITIIYFAKKTLFEGLTVKFLGWFSLLKRYENFSMGILSISDIVYYITFSAAFIFLTVRMIDKRRWS